MRESVEEEELTRAERIQELENELFILKEQIWEDRKNTQINEYTEVCEFLNEAREFSFSR